MSASMNATAIPVPLLFKAIEGADINTLKHALKSMCGASTECSASAARFLLIQKGQAAMDDEEDHDDEEEEEDHDDYDEEEEDDDDDDEEEEEDDDEEAEEDDDKEREHKDEDEEEEAKESRRAKRRKLNHDFTGVDAELISRYETCAVCKERFDLTMYNRKACTVHTGDLEIDDSNAYGWADDDEYMYERAGINPYTDWRREEFPDLFKWNCCDGDALTKPCQFKVQTWVQAAFDQPLVRTIAPLRMGCLDSKHAYADSDANGGSTQASSAKSSGDPNLAIAGLAAGGLSSHGDGGDPGGGCGGCGAGCGCAGVGGC